MKAIYYSVHKLLVIPEIRRKWEDVEMMEDFNKHPHVNNLLRYIYLKEIKETEIRKDKLINKLNPYK